ncbi:MAG: SLC26A/SulP transporter family protein [candidate division Zixibacteria bacterium]|nr:SLC26A/SulP transporter family protein [candidate division Zixibacteria bacterium]
MTGPSHNGSGSSGISGEIFGGLAAMLVAMPSAIAFGLVVYAPLGGDAAAAGALAGIIGAIVLGIVAPLFGGAPGIITAPCAPAAAVMGALAAHLAAGGPENPDLAIIQVLLMLTALLSGGLQLLYGLLGGGSIIKFIPYPVVAGYLSGVGILIFTGQLPKFLGTPKGTRFFDAIARPDLWQTTAIAVGIVAIVGMVFSKKITRTVPAPIIALLCGVAAYFGLSPLYPDLLALEHNPFVIGAIASGSGPGFFESLASRLSAIGNLDTKTLDLILIPALTLSVLLSVDTLKTGVILDALTRRQHKSNRELIGQGIGNLATAVAGGMPGAGTMGATLVNVTSGGRDRLSGILNGVFALVAFLALGSLIAWIPVAALSGILMVVGIRMIDRETFYLMRQKATLFDFLVILAVVVTAVGMDLITAAGVGIGFAILLFLRDQIRGSVIHRKLWGNRIFSKKRRPPSEMAILEQKGEKILIVELEGPLFFGTADQLLSEIQPLLGNVRYMILNMKRVRSLDFTAAHRLEQMETQLHEQGGCLILSDLPRFMSSGERFEEYLSHVGILEEFTTTRLFGEMDEALEWAEDRTLEMEGVVRPTDGHPLDLSEIHILAQLKPQEIEWLRPCVRKVDYPGGEKIFSRGDSGDTMYLIGKGEVRISLPLSDGKIHHLVTFNRGDFFGDMSFLDNTVRSADAIAATDCELYGISRIAFNGVAEQAPHLAEQVFAGLCHILAERLRQANMEIRALQES